jgi:hypothetical protein
MSVFNEKFATLVEILILTLPREERIEKYKSTPTPLQFGPIYI